MQDQIVTILLARASHYFDIMRTTLFSMTAIAIVIHVGPDGYSAPLTALVIALAAYGILAGGVALTDMSNLRQDLPEGLAETAYGKALVARNLEGLRAVSTALITLVAVAELYVIWT